MKTKTNRNKRQDKGYSKARKIFLANEKHVCHYCETKCVTKQNKPNTVTVDHVIPWSKQPELKRDPKNFVVSCLKCNQEKADMSYEEFKSRRAA